MVEPHSSKFRVITTNILGVRIFRKFTLFRVSSLYANVISSMVTCNHFCLLVISIIFVFTVIKTIPVFLQYYCKLLNPICSLVDLILTGHFHEELYHQ